MTWFYRTFIRPPLFGQDSEEIHNRTLAVLAWASRNESFCEALAAFLHVAALPVRLFGLDFPNPVGLAAGMDKQAAAVPAWAALGFGFSELGGVTWHPQPGNPAPRLFRVVADKALINRMGFNNSGAEAMAMKLAEWRSLSRWPGHPVGINLGKSKITPLDQAAADYANSLRALWPLADFFVVNVSSPNTPNLRQLQDKSALNEILSVLQEVNSQCARAATCDASEQKTPVPMSQLSVGQTFLSAGSGDFPVAHHRTGLESPVNRQAGKPTLNPPEGLKAQGAIEVRGDLSMKPILVKVAPDLSFEALDEILELAGPRQIAGLVATNTTIARPSAGDPSLQRVYAEAGGLSGQPLKARSTAVIRHLYRQTQGAVPIIGVGGIFNAADAWEKITAGASLVQLYTGLIYEGPGIVREIVAGLRQRLEKAGMKEFHEAVGCAAQA
jgi:dihydroorotate dehydrogenase